MGTWGIEPWDNDRAADWFGDTFERLKIAEHVAATLQLDPVDNHEEIRAAASLLVMLGRAYVWPVERLDQDLSLAARKLEQLLAVPELNESEEIIAAIRQEIQELRSRIKDSTVQPPAASTGRKWWQFWK